MCLYLIIFVLKRGNGGSSARNSVRNWVHHRFRYQTTHPRQLLSGATRQGARCGGSGSKRPGHLQPLLPPPPPHTAVPEIAAPPPRTEPPRPPETAAPHTAVPGTSGPPSPSPTPPYGPLPPRTEPPRPPKTAAPWARTKIYTFVAPLAYMAAPPPPSAPPWAPPRRKWPPRDYRSGDWPKVTWGSLI